MSGSAERASADTTCEDGVTYGRKTNPTHVQTYTCSLKSAKGSVPQRGVADKCDKCGPQFSQVKQALFEALWH